MKRENLARAYFPDAAPRVAVRRLTAWIRSCPELYSQLTADGRQFDRRRLLTQREVRLIRKAVIILLQQLLSDTYNGFSCKIPPS